MPEKLEISPTGEHNTLNSDWHPEPSTETEQQVVEGAAVSEGSQDAEGLHTRTRSSIQKPLRYKDYVPYDRQGIVWTLMVEYLKVV